VPVKQRYNKIKTKLREKCIPYRGLAPGLGGVAGHNGDERKHSANDINAIRHIFDGRIKDKKRISLSNERCLAITVASKSTAIARSDRQAAFRSDTWRSSGCDRRTDLWGGDLFDVFP
jgi:hypothetical protein